MNLQLLIYELQKAGLTQQAIGAQIGMDQSNVSRLANGKMSSMTYERGAALIALHAKHCKRKKG